MRQIAVIMVCFVTFSVHAETMKPLVTWNTEVPVSWIINKIRTGNDAEKLEALDALSQYGNRAMDAVPELKAILADKINSKLLCATLKVLAAIGKQAKDVENEVAMYLDTNDFQISLLVCSVLTQIGSQDVRMRKVITRIAKGGNALQQVEAAHLAAGFDTNMAIGVFMKALQQRTMLQRVSFCVGEMREHAESALPILRVIIGENDNAMTTAVIKTAIIKIEESLEQKRGHPSSPRDE